MQRVVRAHSARTQNPRTYFFRNRPELDVVTSLVRRVPEGAELSVAVVACSMGAEPYSLLWSLRNARPDLRIDMRAIDLEPEVVAIARNGGPWNAGDFQLQRMTAEEIQGVFDCDGEQLRVKESLATRLRSSAPMGRLKP